MAVISNLHYLHGGYAFDAIRTTFSAFQVGNFANAATDSVELVDSFGDRVVFHGSFVVNGGVVQSGTITGFDTFAGTTKVLVGSGYSFSFADLTTVVTDAHSFLFTSFENLFYDHVVNQVGSADDDFMFGANFGGRMVGKGGNDTLVGGPGRDVIKGGPGDDLLAGLQDMDKLKGGEGHDFFSFDLSGLTRVKDFTPGEDKILLGIADFSNLTQGFLLSREFHVGAHAKTADQHVLYDPKTGLLEYDPDGVGGVDPTVIGHLSKHLAPHAHDFIVGFFDFD